MPLFALVGTTVHLVDIAVHLLPAEARWAAGEALAGRLREDGVKIHLVRYRFVLDLADLDQPVS